MDAALVLVRPVAVFGALMSLVPLLVLAERRIAAWIQNRVGPNRVGPGGLLQPLADILKLAFKEDLRPAGSDRLLYPLAPVMAMLPPAFAFAAIPVGRDLQVARMDIGVLFVVSATSLGVYGISFGGWASNNKYSLLGGLRSSAQIISYEIAMGLSLVSLLMVAGTVDLQDIVLGQRGLLHWNVFAQPLAFLIFFIAAFAENNRLPFDLPECEAELVGGYHTEYSSMRFATFFLGEYIAMVTMSSLLVTLFLGGWDPGLFTLPEGVLGTALSVGVFLFKVLAVLFVYMWVRWTLPRFRYDQLMHLGWKGLIPLGLGNIALTAVVLAGLDAWKGRGQ
jgi:NADH-quinone oxidoreductase subunit H